MTCLGEPFNEVNTQLNDDGCT